MPKNTTTGPKPGKSHGRNRNTGINLLSKQADYGQTTPAQPFGPGPSDATEFGLQKSNLWYKYRVQNASLRAQAQLARSGYKNARGSIRDEMRAGISETGGELADRGLIGSTSHVAAEEDVRADAAAQRSAAREQFIREILGVRTGKLQNIADLRMGLGEVAIRKAALKRELALGAFAGAGVNPWGYQTG